MAYSYMQFTSTGVENKVTLTFSYLDKTDVHLYVNSVRKPFEWDNDKTISFAPTPQGTKVEIRRFTDRSKVNYTLSDGIPFTRRIFDQIHVQSLYIAQEVSDSGVLLEDTTLREVLRSSGGASTIGYSDTTIAAILDTIKPVTFFAPVLDYGPIVNALIQTMSFGGIVYFGAYDYPFLTPIERRAGIFLQGAGVHATWLSYNGNDALIKNAKVVLNDRKDRLIGNNTGQYHTGITKLTLHGNGTGIGLWRGEGWWDKVDHVIIEGFDVGEKNGLGTSAVTGCYWCRNESVWYRDNRVNMQLTDFSNLNTWANCRFSNAREWDVEVLEPTSALLLGQQGNRLEDCEFASPDGVFLGAKIFDMCFHNPYFEQPGYAVYDGTNHSKRKVTFTGTPKFFGSKSTKNKVVAGTNGGNCQKWSFDDISTNLGKGSDAPETMEVIEMGAKANYFHVKCPNLVNTPGWVLTSDSNLTKTKMQVLDTNGESVLFMKKILATTSIVENRHTVVDYNAKNNIGVDMFEKGVEVGALNNAWVTVLEVPDFAVTFAHATLHYELTVCGRNAASNNAKSANLSGEIIGVNGELGTFVEVYNRQAGSTAVTIEHRVIQSSEAVQVQIRTATSSTQPLDQTFCAVEARSVGKFTELCI